MGKAAQNANTIALRWSQFAAYARDQWQITPRLTLNYGVRWEFYPMAYSDIGGARVLDTSSMNVLVGGGSSGIPVDDHVDVHAGLFLPRIGIAYRPFEKTVIRAGYGMSADPNNWRFLRNSYPADTISDFTGNFYAQAANSGFAPAASLTGVNALGPYTYLPTGITPIAILPNAPGTYPLPNGVGTTTVPLDFRRGYINSFNLTLEREFAGFVADAAYVGERGIRPLTNMNVNPAPGGGGQKGRILNAQFGGNWSDINSLTPYGNNYYDSLQTKLTRRLGGSSQIGVAYTWSKAIDFEDNEEINFILFPYPAYLSRNKALAGFDRTNNFEFYGLYELPFGRDKRWASQGIASKLAGGWQLNWVLSAMSGTPFTITDSGSGATAFERAGKHADRKHRRTHEHRKGVAPPQLPHRNSCLRVLQPRSLRTGQHTRRAGRRWTRHSPRPGLLRTRHEPVPQLQDHRAFHLPIRSRCIRSDQHSTLQQSQHEHSCRELWGSHFHLGHHQCLVGRQRRTASVVVRRKANLLTATVRLALD